MRLWDGLKIIDALLFLFLVSFFFSYFFSIASQYLYSMGLLRILIFRCRRSVALFLRIPLFLPSPFRPPTVLFPSFSFVWIFSPTFFFEVAIRVELIIVSYHTERRTGYDIRLFFPPKKTIMILWVLVCVVFFELETTGTLSFSSFFLFFHSLLSFSFSLFLLNPLKELFLSLPYFFPILFSSVFVPPFAREKERISRWWCKEWLRLEGLHHQNTTSNFVRDLGM